MVVCSSGSAKDLSVSWIRGFLTGPVRHAGGLGAPAATRPRYPARSARRRLVDSRAPPPEARSMRSLTRARSSSSLRCGTASSVLRTGSAPQASRTAGSRHHSAILSRYHIGPRAHPRSPDAVRTAIASVRSRRYRVIVIDCPPALSRLVLAAWRAAPDAITVLPVDNPSALRAVRRFRGAWGDAGLDPSRLRVVLTRFDERRVIDKKLAEEAREAPEILIEARIRESVVVPESAAWQKPLIAFAPRHALTEDVRRVARELANA